jgi:hypothetical protein
MRFDEKQIAPPKSWARFEDLCLSLFRTIWGDPLAQKEGRLGQPQHGVDVWGNPASNPTQIHGVQCKGKDVYPTRKVTIREFDGELAKAENFEPTLAHWTLASTARTDAALQKHVRQLSITRHKAGKFPVRVLGWDDLLHLIAEHPDLIELYYPDHGQRIHDILGAIQAQPSRAEWQELKLDVAALRSSARSEAVLTGSQWLEVPIGTSRGLGPALTGRALGPADAAACPRLPEADTLLAELARRRIYPLRRRQRAGRNGCALQAARDLASKGFRIVKLLDARTAPIRLTDARKVLHIVDDAHLATQVALELAEHSAGPERLLLSIHTSTQESVPGSIHLDARRAVRVISEGLKTRWEETLAEVARVDDWVGRRMLDERLEDRFAAADQAEFPWQFGFILGGGWRRVATIASSCRAVGHDIALAGIALHQLASRDAIPGLNDILALLAAASIEEPQARSAIDWLTGQRLINGPSDLRSPHQRFAAKLLGPIVDGQSLEGRQSITRMVANLLSCRALPLAGLGTILVEWRLGDAHRAKWLLGRCSLDPLLDRCWAADDPEDIRAACAIFGEMEVYDDGFYASFTRDQVERIAGWFTEPTPGTGYSVGRFINATWRFPKLGTRIARASDPIGIACRLNSADADFAAEIASMVQQSSSALPRSWKIAYLGAVDRDRARRLAAAWPDVTPLYALADYCAHFTLFERDFGLKLVELTLPRLQEALAKDPVRAFGTLDDLFRSALRVDDPLGVYRGRLAPTPRMRYLARRILEIWDGPALATRLSDAPVRDFQTIAQILHVLKKVDRPRFNATVDAMNWEKIDGRIGALWSRPPHEVQVLLGTCHVRPRAKAAIARLIERRFAQMEVLPPRLALMSPASAQRAVMTDKKIAIAEHGHVAWDFGSVMIELHERDPTLPARALRTQLAGIAAALSQAHPSWYDEALTFLRLFRQFDAEGFVAMLGLIKTDTARTGWATAIETEPSDRRRRRRKRATDARDTAAWLIEQCLNRQDATGEMARQLRKQLGEISIPRAELLETLD